MAINVLERLTNVIRVTERSIIVTISDAAPDWTGYVLTDQTTPQDLVGKFTFQELAIENEGSNGSMRTLFTNASDDAPGADFIGRSSRGTLAAPTASQIGDILLRLGGRGYGASAYSILSKASVDFKAAENWTDSAQGAYIQFYTTPNGTTTELPRVRIDNNGNTGFGVTLPLTLVDLAAGTTTTAPFRLASGTALTTPVNGVMEYHASHLYFTIGSTRYQLDQQAASSNIKHIVYGALAPDANQAIAQAGGTVRLHMTGTIVAVGCYDETAGITGTAIYDIQLNGTSIMASTKISIESGEDSSLTAATQPVITTTALAVDDKLTFFCLDIQSGTPAKGGTFWLDIEETV